MAFRLPRVSDRSAGSTCSRSIAVVAALGFLIGIPGDAYAQEVTHPTYYAVDFGSPPNTVGQPPAVGTGPYPRDTPSAILNGAPTVVASYGVLTDQPLLFSAPASPAASVDQIDLDLGVNEDDVFYIDFDLTIGSLSTSSSSSDGFIVFIDVPTAKGIRFHADGTITGFESGSTTVIGSWQPGELMSVSLVVGNDHTTNPQLWQLFINDSLVGEQMLATPFVGGVRFALAMNEPTETSEVAIDDIAVESDDIEVVPPAPAPTASPAVIINSAGDGAGHMLDGPQGIAADTDGDVYVAGGSSGNAFRITPGGHITLIIDSSGDGLGNGLTAAYPIAVDADHDVFVAGRVSDNVFRITPQGTITEIIDASGDGLGDTLDQPSDLAVDDAGNVYVTGFGSSNAFRITPGGTVTEILDELGDDAGHFVGSPSGIAVGPDGNVYVADQSTHSVFEIAPGGTISVILDATGDGAGHPLSQPGRPAVSPDGDVYVPGTSSDNVFRVTPTGTITQVLDASGDGAGHPADFPGDVAIGGDGTVYVACSSSNNVFAIAPGGTIEQIIDLSGDGTHQLRLPGAVAVNPDGLVFVTGTVSDNAFRIGNLAATLPTLGPTGLLSMLGALVGAAYWRLGTAARRR